MNKYKVPKTAVSLVEDNGKE